MPVIKKINLNGTSYDIADTIPYEVKSAMDTLFLKMGVEDRTGYTSEYASIHAWASSVSISSISAVFTQGTNKVFTCDSLEILRQYLVVTATYDDGTSAIITTYDLSGTLTAGTSTITVSYQNVSTTFTVTVIAGTDVTPALSSFANIDHTVTHTVSGSSIRVQGTGVGRCVYSPITPREGYTYRMSCDVVVTNGYARFGIENASTELGILLVPSSATQTSGSYIGESVLSESERWTTNANVKLWCTWTTSTTGDVTFSNLKIVEYLAS